MRAFRKAQDAYQTQDYGLAKRWVDRAIQTDPKNPHAHILAGNLSYRAHDLDVARDHWAKALQLDPRLRVLHHQLHQLDQEAALEAEQTAGGDDLFVIRVPDGEAGIDSAQVLEILREAQSFLKGKLQWTFEGPISVLVYRPEVFYRELHAPAQVAGLYDGKIRMPLRDGGVGPSMKAILWHELAHVAVTQMSDGRAPRWLQEGAAQVVESEVGLTEKTALTIAVRAKTIPSLGALEGREAVAQGAVIPMEAGLFYQASWGCLQYLVDHRGWSGLKALLEYVANGTPSRDAFYRLLGVNEDQWQRLWKRWLRGWVEPT